MRKLLLILLLINTSIAFAQNKSYDYCYMRKNTIYVYSATDKKEIFVAKSGADPYLSPDGKKVAYTVNDGENRYIRIIDLNTMAKIPVNTYSNNCYGPIWSPDGLMLLFNVFDINHSGDWSVAVINATLPAAVVASKVFAPQWLANSKYIDVQDLNKVYVLTLSGNLISSYSIAALGHGFKELSGDGGASSSDIFKFTNDGKKIVFTSEVNEPGGSDGFPSALFVYDIDTKKTIRLSPKGYSASRPFMKGNTILFEMSKNNTSAINIYTIGMDAKNMKLLFANSSNISAKN